MVEQLRRNAAILREGRAAPRRTPHGARPPKVPGGGGDARRAMALCERTLEGGVFAQAIRPPTVPAGTSRLRLTVMASHRADDLRRAAGVIGAAALELGLADGYARAA
jgi:glycine C-acetyltransferase/8-amino-7-oxononanoate synthase